MRDDVGAEGRVKNCKGAHGVLVCDMEVYIPWYLKEDDDEAHLWYFTATIANQTLLQQLFAARRTERHLHQNLHQKNTRSERTDRILRELPRQSEEGASWGFLPQSLADALTPSAEAMP